MLNLISFAAVALISLSAFSSDAGAASKDTISLDSAGADLIFEQIVENAVADCRAELSGDVFANFRLQSCVEAKVSEGVATAGGAQLADYAAAYPDYLLTASAP